jgi:hypothetical protein
MALTLQFTQASLTNVADAAGQWQFEGGQAAENGKQVANYASVKRTVTKGTDQNGQNAATATMTILFLGAMPPENITLQGVHGFNDGWEIGSVSAASTAYVSYIGHQYTRVGQTNVVTIS